MPVCPGVGKMRRCVSGWRDWDAGISVAGPTWPVPTTAPRVQRAHATGQPSREAERAAARREWGLLAREKPAFRPESRALREWREARRFDLGAGEGGDY